MVYEMDQFETVLLPHLEQYSIYLVLFRNVSNAEFLREQLITGNTAFQYTFLDASMVSIDHRHHLQHPNSIHYYRGSEKS